MGRVVPLPHLELTWTSRNRCLRTPSGPGGSSGKQDGLCRDGIYVISPGGTDDTDSARIRMHGQDLIFCTSPHNPHPMDKSSIVGTLNRPTLLHTKGPVSYLRHPGLSRHPRLAHGIFTRKGGVSIPPYHFLNTSYEVGDLQENVRANLGLISHTLGADHLVFMRQSHGTTVYTLARERKQVPVEPPNADAVITDIPRVALLVKQADCQGVIIFDSERQVVANVHCGWRGNVNNILGRVVARMGRGFRSRSQDLIAAIGPSLGPCCAEFVDHGKIFPPDFEEFMVGDDHFNLWAISERQLLEAGLRRENIEICGICTRCAVGLFYSYRGEGKTGRFGTAAMLA